MSAADGSAALVLTLPDGGVQVFVLGKASVTIGRAMTNDIVLRDDGVSRSHALVERTADAYEVVDLGSANGIHVNGHRQTRAPLSIGDRLTAGESSLRFASTSEESSHGVTIHIEEHGVPRLAVSTPHRTWEIPLPDDRLTIGRDGSNDLILDDPNVSRHHAVIERLGGEVVIRDLGSANGTWNSEGRLDRAVLHDGQMAQIGTARLVFKGEVSTERLEHDLITASIRRRPVVIIPGFAGSTLWSGDEQVWPTLRMGGLPKSLHMDRALEARAIVDQVVVIPNVIRLDQYGLLSGYLKESLGYETGRDLLEFAYDFRQDNRVSARRLASAIKAWGVSEPITIIAHSMGCLIARYYVERLGGARHVERVVLLGGPHAGSPYAFASLLTGPNLLPLGLMNERLRTVISTFPAWYQILPTYPCVTAQAPFEVLLDETWAGELYRPLVRNARQFRRELGTESSVPAVCIFGYGVKTINGATVARDGAGLVTDATVTTTESGDGTIPQTSAVLPEAEIHPVRQHHGSLYVDKDVKMRLKLELTRPR